MDCQKLGNMVSINTTDRTKMGYYEIKLISEVYKLQEEATCDGKISSADDIVVKAQCMECMKDNINWYW